MTQGAVVLYFVQQVSLGKTFCVFRLIDVAGVENWLINHAAYKMLAFSPSGRKKIGAWSLLVSLFGGHADFLTLSSPGLDVVVCIFNFCLLL